jgi:hypothetical protein
MVSSTPLGANEQASTQGRGGAVSMAVPPHGFSRPASSGLAARSPAGDARRISKGAAMEMLVIGFVLGGLVMFAFTRHHAAQAELYKRLYEEATKGVGGHLHDALTVDAARRIVARDEARQARAEDERTPDSSPEPPPEKPKPKAAIAPKGSLKKPGPRFLCLNCKEDVKWGGSHCRYCDVAFAYTDGYVSIRADHG